MSGWGDALRFQAATPAQSGRFAVDVSADWNVGSTPNGGYVLALAQEVARQAQPFGLPVSASATYLTPTSAGPAEVWVDVLRVGRTTSTVAALLVQDGRTRLTLTATFADLAPDSRLAAHPSKPWLREIPRTDCVPLPRLLPSGVEVSIVDHATVLVPPQPVVTAHDGSLVTTGWFRLGRDEPAEVSVLPLAVDAFTPIAAGLGRGGWSPTLTLSVLTRARPRSAWLRVDRRMRELSSGHFDEETEVRDDGGRLVAQGRQLARLG